MKITFLGVGEAFDENYTNNSHLVTTEKTNLLLDCGFSAPSQIWKCSGDPNFLDAINISHRHADHYFGLPALFLRMWEEGREKDLSIICPKSLIDNFQQLMDLAYNGVKEKFKYNINLVEPGEESAINFQDLRLSFEKTTHPEKDLTVKISDGKNIMAYSGDGSPVPGTDFYKDLDLLILETYLYDQEKIGHSSVVSGIKFAEENNVKTLALTHLNRNFRKNDLPNLRGKIKSDKVNVIIPEPLDQIEL